MSFRRSVSAAEQNLNAAQISLSRYKFLLALQERLSFLDDDGLDSIQQAIDILTQAGLEHKAIADAIPISKSTFSRWTTGAAPRSVAFRRAILETMRKVMATTVADAGRNVKE